MNIRDFLLFAGLNGGSGGSGGGSCNIQRIESLDTSNLVSFRDLDSGVYVLYGYFTPFTGSDVSMIVDDALVSIARRDAGTHLMCFTALNGKINFIEILVDESAPGGHTYTRTDYKLSELAEQPDWSQNDSTKPDYVKNRTHWTDDPVETVLFDGMVANDGDCPIVLTVGQEYTVTLKGVEYVVTAKDGYDEPYVGNDVIYNGEEYDGSEPPFCFCNGWFCSFGVEPDWEDADLIEAPKYNLKVTSMVGKIHKIDPKYLPVDAFVEDTAKLVAIEQVFMRHCDVNAFIPANETEVHVLRAKDYAMLSDIALAYQNGTIVPISIGFGSINPVNAIPTSLTESGKLEFYVTNYKPEEKIFERYSTAIFYDEDNGYATYEYTYESKTIG